MNNVFEYEGYKFEKGSVTKVTDPLTVESPLQININGDPFTVVMQTPGDEIDLTYGLIYAENVFHDINLIEITLQLNDSGLVEQINIASEESNLADGYLSSRSLLSVSSCGICGKREVKNLHPTSDHIKSKSSATFSQLFKMQNTMKQAQQNFELTGGCHGVALFDNQYNLLFLREDIGRHNALDKCIGASLRANRLKKAAFIIFSGRISYEIVSKAFRAKIPFISAISSPSSLAIDFAKEYGMTLVGFTRKNKATCYSNPQNLII